MTLLTPVSAPRADESEPIDARPLDIPMDPMRGMMLGTGEDLPPVNAAPAPSAPADAAPAFDPEHMPTPQTAILRVTFAEDDAVLNPQAQSEIEAFAKDFKERGGRVALKGYAGQPGDSSSNMRRLSLKRVLAVREQLLALGIAPERLDVRALGGVRDTGPKDRVDIVKSGR